jgi:hypothetical protein
MTKFRKIIASFIGGLVMGSSASAMNDAPAKKPVEAKIQQIMKAIYAKNIHGIQSKTLFEYLEKNHNLSLTQETKAEVTDPEINTGNWDTWSTWSNWDTWSTWGNWDTWSTWGNWDTWSNWSNY